MKTRFYFKTNFLLNAVFVIVICLSFTYFFACTKQNNPEPSIQDDSEQIGNQNDSCKNPISISSITEFLAMESGTAGHIKCYTLKANLDFSSVTIDQLSSYEYIHLEGNHRTCSNLVLLKDDPSIDAGRVDGLFRVLKYSIVRNLIISNFQFLWGSAYAGALVGDLHYSELHNIKVTNSIIHGSYRSGGIVGMATASKIFNSSSNGKLLAINDVGGIVGRIEVSGHIEDCSSSMAIEPLNRNYSSLPNVPVTTGGIIGSVDGNNVIIKNNFAQNSKIVGEPKGSSNYPISDKNYPGFFRIVGEIKGDNIILENNRASDKINMFLYNGITPVPITNLKSIDVGSDKKHGETVSTK